MSPRLPLSACPLQEGEQMTPPQHKNGPFHLPASAWETALLIVCMDGENAIHPLHKRTLPPFIFHYVERETLFLSLSL